MKKYFLQFTMLLMLTFSVTMIAQTDTISVIQKIETSSVSNLDEFITKYEPKISNRLGQLWEFSKTTTHSMYKAFVRYLFVKDGFPILLGLLVILLLKRIANRLKITINNSLPLFSEVVTKDSYTEYENLTIEKDNFRHRLYNMFLNSLPTNLFYVGLAIVVYNLIPYLYNLGLLLFAPEARVLLELTNLYKTF